MRPTEAFEPIPETRPRPRRRRQTRVATGARRRRLRHARRVIAAFPPGNRYQAELQDVALAMITYMDENWCGPEHAYDYQRWWRIVDYYTRALGSPELAAARDRELLDRILDQDQVPPILL